MYLLMKDKDILEKQVEILRGMDGARRVELALGLSELSLEMARAGIRAKNPGISEEEVKERLKERLS